MTTKISIALIALIAYSSSRTGVKGVSWHRASGKYTAQIQANGRKTYLGTFDTIAEAAAAYERAAREQHGSFARVTISGDTFPRSV